MKKNVAGQSIGAQMVSATDGSAFTGAVVVRVTGDNGTQTLGSVSSGACTHEGNGYHSYAPAQAETNFNHIAWTFTGTGAIPTTVQLYTEVNANITGIDGNTTAPTILQRHARAVVRFTVGSGSTLTSIVTSSLLPAGTVNDQFNGKSGTFDDTTATAALRGQVFSVLDFTASGGTITTTSPLTTAPASGDTGTLS